MLCAPAAYKNLFFAPGSYTSTLLTFNELAKWIVGWPVYPADAPLWFVRDLLLLITIVPMWNMLPKRVQIAGLGALFAYWVLGPIDLVPGGIPRVASVFFFLSGAWVGMNQFSLPVGPAVNRIMVISGVVFLLSAAVGATCGTMGGDNLAAQPILDKMVRISGALLVVCAGTRTLFPRWLSGPLLRLSPAAFFLFAVHYCVFVCITWLSGKFAPGRLGAGHELLLFVVVFSTVIAVSLGCYFFLRTYAPSLLGMLDGNRSARSSGVRPTKHEVQVSPLPINARPAPSFE